MRFALALLLAVLIPINAAFAAVTALQHAIQPDHHVHVLDDDQEHDHEKHSAQAAGDVVDNQNSGAGPTPPECNHHHAHVHPVFSLMLPTPIGLNLPITTGAPPAPTAETFISATPSRLERPPRFAPVA